mmetsp:Transcript_90345/g.197881  ORF Transcript_90345/g.197881 Transcript_90345/m.197881 type:complete len:114 (-) Transcript_90345:1837-2178(-)
MHTSPEEDQSYLIKAATNTKMKPLRGWRYRQGCAPLETTPLPVALPERVMIEDILTDTSLPLMSDIPSTATIFATSASSIVSEYRRAFETSWLIVELTTATTMEITALLSTST